MSRVCLTWCSYPKDYLLFFRCLDIKYGILGFEVSSYGTPHIQGYVEFNKHYSFWKLRRMFPHCHLEYARADRIANSIYCCKSGKYIFL